MDDVIESSGTYVDLCTYTSSLFSIPLPQHGMSEHILSRCCGDGMQPLSTAT